MITCFACTRPTELRLLVLFAALCALLQIAIPELPLYKNTLRRGVAKLAIHVVDLETNQIVHRSGPVEGSAFRRSTTFFFVFESRDSDTTRLE